MELFALRSEAERLERRCLAAIVVGLPTDQGMHTCQR